MRDAPVTVEILVHLAWHRALMQDANTYGTCTHLALWTRDYACSLHATDHGPSTFPSRIAMISAMDRGTHSGISGRGGGGGISGQP